MGDRHRQLSNSLGCCCVIEGGFEKAKGLRVWKSREGNKREWGGFEKRIEKRGFAERRKLPFQTDKNEKIQGELRRDLKLKRRGRRRRELGEMKGGYSGKKNKR
ncbi:hypothetical protein ACH5RR_018463 [Cinchona calisaya]|uniref:Uncharacterized protein n=1 Tax=Cinchona calisaya TaxID=153742 RepID=A0ABD2ZM23_9GENT